MALKFLNKKGWHTGSLRNIENVWKAEQKHEAEQRKLEELRKQIGEEREKAEFRQLQEQAGLVPRQERLDFLYESGLAVGKGSSEGFKALQPAVAAASVPAGVPVSGESSSSKAAAPGALFEDNKPQSANDAWRKLHSDPLLLIRQREQDALAKIKNNPIKMAMIKKSVEAEKKDKEGKKEKRRHKKHHHHKSKNEKHREDNSDSDASDDHEQERKRKREHLIPKSKHKKKSSGDHSNSEYSDDERDKGRRNNLKSEKGEDTKRKNEKRQSRARSDSEDRSSDENKRRRKPDYMSERHDGDLRHEKHESRVHSYSRDRSEVENKRSDYSSSKHLGRENPSRSIEEDERRKNGHFTSEHGANKRENYQPRYNRSKGVPKMTEEEREARLREMQLDAELHEDQRWKRLKKAADADAQEAMRANSLKGKNFLDDAQKSIFGTEKGGSTTIEESVRRRAFYSQGSSAAHDNNAFRR